MASATASLRENRGSAPAKPVEALQQLLDALAAVILGIPREAYTARPVPEVSGSIGAQVRHMLDHIAAFVAAAPTMPLSYDHRERGTAIESDPATALRTIFRLKTAISACGDDCLLEPLEVVTQVSSGGETLRAWSSRARELAFVQSHTIHHQAIISLLLVVQGYAAPAGFGYAPSTPRA